MVADGLQVVEELSARLEAKAAAMVWDFWIGILMRPVDELISRF